MRRLELLNKQFGRLVVLEEASPRIYRNKKLRTWKCLCSCGNSVIVLQNNLVHGLTRACGCLRFGNQNALIHGHRSKGQHGKTYKAWCSMKFRCTNSKHPKFKNWGGRGITVCERWESFENFLNDMGHAPEGLTLERVDNEGDYEPGNCCWATWKEQAANRRQKHVQS